MEKYKLQDLPEDQINNINITPETIKIANDWNSGECIHPIIIPTNDISDLQMQWNAWKSLSITKQRISDSKAVEIFGVTNTEIYNYIMADLSKRNKVNNDISSIEVPNVPIVSITTESAALLSLSTFRESVLEEGINSPKYAVYENYLNTIEKLFENKNSDLSFQAFIELKKLHKDIKDHNINENAIYPIINIERAPYSDSINENSRIQTAYTDEIGNQHETYISVNEWNDMYYAYLNGYLTDDFKNSIKYRNSFLESQYSLLNHLNNQLLNESNDYVKDNTNKMIAHLEKSIEEVSGSATSVNQYFTNEYFKNANSVNIVDVSNMSCKYITESTEESKIKPIFLIQSYGAKWYSKIIRDFSKGPYSHISISIDPTLKKIYSFQNYGFEIESLDKYIEKSPNGEMTIYCMFVSKEDYDIIDDKIDYFLKNIHKTSYNWARLLAIMMKRPGVSKNKLVCSQFVDLMMKCIDIDLTGKDPSLSTPNDFKLSEQTAIYLLFDGPCKNMTPQALKEVLNKVNVLSNSVGCTYKESIGYNSVIKNVLANESDLSILRYYKDKLLMLESDNDSYVLNLKPYLETYVFDPKKLEKKTDIDLEYDGRHIKKLIEGDID